MPSSTFWRSSVFLIPPVPRWCRPGQRDVLADERCISRASCPVGRHVDQARPDRIRGVAEGDRRTYDEQFAALGRSDPAGVEQLVLPCPSRATTPSTSPGSRSNETSTSLCRAARLEPRFVASRRRPGRWRVRSATAACPRRCAEHELDDALLGTLGHVDDPDVLAFAQHGARSHTAAISIMRCEMKMTERSPPRWRPMTSRTRW